MRRPKLIGYRARDGWRWHLRAANGRIIAESGEAYSSRCAVERAMWKLPLVVGLVDHGNLYEVRDAD